MGVIYTLDIQCDYPGCTVWETGDVQAIRPPPVSDAMRNLPPGWRRRHSRVWSDEVKRWVRGKSYDLCPDHSDVDVPHVTFPAPS